MQKGEIKIMIDTDVRVQAAFFRRWLTVKQLKQILSQLDDENVLFPNRVGNLSVVRDAEQRMIGYIDFNEEKFEEV